MIVARVTLVVVALVAAVALAGCGSDEEPTVESGATTTSSSSSPTTSVPGAPFGTTQVSTQPHTQGYGLLQAVRTGVHEGYVRVTFEFDALPAHRVEFGQRPVTQDGSGEEVEVAGEAVLAVNMQPASTYDLEGDKLVYKGPKRIAIASPAVPEVVFVGDFEASLNWAIALDEQRPFRVFTLDGPPRIVVDVQTRASES